MRGGSWKQGSEGGMRPVTMNTLHVSVPYLAVHNTMHWLLGGHRHVNRPYQAR